MDLNRLKNAAYSGIISGSSTALLFQPLEVIKTKLQQPINRDTSISAVIRSTYKSEGLKSFWNGLTPALYRSVPVVIVYFSAIETFKSIKLFNYASGSMLATFFIGATARAISDVAVFPLALIKTRYESDMYRYGGMSEAFKDIVKHSGYSGLYKGLCATVARDTGYSGLYFMIYSKIKHDLDSTSSINSSTIASIAFVSSLIACLLTQPPDAIRTRMQLSPECKTIKKSVKIIYKSKGIYGFFTGFTPRFVRRTSISVLSWTIFEKMT